MPFNSTVPVTLLLIPSMIDRDEFFPRFVTYIIFSEGSIDIPTGDSPTLIFDL